MRYKRKIKPLFYKNSDYTVRMEINADIKRYFIKFNMEDSPEQEISRKIFKLYYRKFNKPLERQRNEHRRHIEDGKIDDFIISGNLTVKLFEQESISKVDLETILKTCTQAQQKRFKLHYIQGYTLEEIAKLENCTNQAISYSIEYVKKKIKISLYDTWKTSDF